MWREGGGGGHRRYTPVYVLLMVAVVQCSAKVPYLSVDTRSVTSFAITYQNQTMIYKPYRADNYRNNNSHKRVNVCQKLEST
jgi:hypothetical protein